MNRRDPRPEHRGFPGRPLGQWRRDRFWVIGRRLLVVLVLTVMAAPSAHAIRHDFRVRNFTNERIDVQISPLTPLSDGNTAFGVADRTCVESDLLFFDACRYEICFFGARTGFRYGCRTIDGCGPAGYDVEAGMPIFVDGVAHCGECPYFPCFDDDEEDSDVYVSCFLDGASTSNAHRHFLYAVLGLVSAAFRTKRPPREPRSLS